ncbi:MAG: DUF4411 family protein [Candidatus Nealsonbacteria bacterium]|nr:DUF4411 family protein [Candidatus Nealsonbacteria bacterium]
MSSTKKYLLDANVFIQAKNQYYAFTIFPGFWKSLIVENGRKSVFSIDRVSAELDKGSDELADWANDAAPETFFKKTDDKAVFDWLTKILNWVQSEPQYTPEAKGLFAAGADPWLIAYAKANGLVLVTLEEPIPQAKRRVPIPNVCLEFDVKCVNTFEMLTEQQTHFVLAKRK